MLRSLRTGLLAAAATVVAFSSAVAEELNFYNWTEYTSPELIEMFEKETGIKVNLDTYDSNETLLAKLQSGATGYDVAVPSQNFVEIMIKEGLIQKFGAAGMSNYGNLNDQFQKPTWDPEGLSTGVQLLWAIVKTSTVKRLSLGVSSLNQDQSLLVRSKFSAHLTKS